MHYVGIDLAWGERKPSGVAVLDGDARLLHVAAAQSDEEIREEIAAYVEGPCLVGIDAPVVVLNATGSRPAEQQLGKDFRRFEAGAHPSNTGKPEFAHGTRAGRLCRALGLDHDPASTADRRAIEVYPHAATVALFDLPRTLKYKNKPGRDLESLRTEMLALVGLVETVVHVDDTWRGLRRQVETAARKSQLRVVEDQVDAVVCAFVALFADRHPADTTTYGDAATGAITTPSPGASKVLRTPPDGGDGDAGRRSRGTSVPLAVQTYAERQPALVHVGRSFTDLVTDVLDEAGINYLAVTGRTKSVTSFAEKAARRGPDGALLHPDPLHDITDQIGIRVVAYVRSDVEAVADLLAAQLHVREDRDIGEETAQAGRFGYASRHLLVEVTDPDAAAHDGQDGQDRRPYSHLRGWTASVQLRTVLQHAWAEFEHEARYKGRVPAEHAGDLDRRFTLAAGLLELADTEFESIRARLRPAQVDSARSSDDGPDDPRLDPRELAAFLAGQYDDAGWSRTDHYGWISGLLLELGVTGLDELAEVLRRPELVGLNERLGYRYPPGAVRRLDDALLAAYGERYIGLTGNAHRVEALTSRLARSRTRSDGEESGTRGS
ncbi:DUF429 domain-containing protein [Nocardioidaceae bacterium]|nr:DUF429 domain-containing protein [Nocardioidaceae bacterium]